VRSISPPDPATLPAGTVLVAARGPFSEDDEVRLLRTHGVDVVVTKNSGGDDAKLRAARRVGATVIMVRRPWTGPAGATTAQAARSWLLGRTPSCTGVDWDHRGAIADLTGAEPPSRRHGPQRRTTAEPHVLGIVDTATSEIRVFEGTFDYFAHGAPSTGELVCFDGSSGTRNARPGDERGHMDRFAGCSQDGSPSRGGARR
jgi:hypothetical protein